MENTMRISIKWSHVGALVGAQLALVVILCTSTSLVSAGLWLGSGLLLGTLAGRIDDTRALGGDDESLWLQPKRAFFASVGVMIGAAAGDVVGQWLDLPWYLQTGLFIAGFFAGGAAGEKAAARF